MPRSMAACAIAAISTWAIGSEFAQDARPIRSCWFAPTTISRRLRPCGTELRQRSIKRQCARTERTPKSRGPFGARRTALRPGSSLGSFHQGHHTCRTRVPTCDPQGRSHQDKPVLANLRKIGHELNQGNAFLEQSKVICDPNLTRIELYSSPDGLFRKNVRRHRRHAFLRHQLADAWLQIGHLPPELGLAPHLFGPARIDHGYEIGTELNPGIQDVLHGNGGIRPFV